MFAEKLGRPERFMIAALLLFGLIMQTSQGCKDRDAEVTPAPVLAQWKVLPLNLVLSDQLNPCQQASMQAAALWWEVRSQRTLWIVRTMPQTDARFSGLIPYGEVTVSTLPVSAPQNVHDATVHRMKDPQYMHSVDIRVTRCSLRGYVHELGHALGFDDVNTKGSLMNKDSSDPSLHITAEELDRLFL